MIGTRNGVSAGSKKWFAALPMFIALFTFHSSSCYPMVVDSFDSSQTDLIEKRGDFAGGGKSGARVPFVNSSLVQDEERGTVLEMDFNVSQGYGGTYILFRPGKTPQDFNQVRFWLRGIHSAFKVELKDDLVHSFIVAKAERSEWREIVIPLSSFSNSKRIDLSRIKEFVFVFEDHRTSPRLGRIDVDDLIFEKDDAYQNQDPSDHELPIPGPVAIDGNAEALPYGTEGAHVLELSCRVPETGRFQEFRFEASWDDLHWFYLGGFPSGTEFKLKWNVSGYPSAVYEVRGVAQDEHGNRKPGNSRKVHIQNTFDFDALLNDVQRRAFDYFVSEVEPNTYLVKDRTVTGSAYSTGLSGFQFTAYVIGVERGWMDRAEALKRINRVMDFMLNDLKRYNGLVPHWLGPGLREIWEPGMGDVVETSYLLAGALTAQHYFDRDDAEEVSLRSKTDRLYREIKWDFLLKRRKPEDERGLLPWHWSEVGGPSKLEVKGYNEAMIVYLLALGAPEHAVSEQSWSAWTGSYQVDRYGDYELIACAPLFTHQYSHLWVDFRDVRDGHANYFENSVLATLANREYSLKENGYEPEIWGLTASEGPNDYKAYGSPPMASSVPVLNDGTIAPTAAAGSIMFTPPISIAALTHMKNQYGERLWGPYGLKDAFNPKLNWFADINLGLNQGPILIAIENYRTGLIWRVFMKNPYIWEGLRKAGFRRDHGET